MQSELKWNSACETCRAAGGARAPCDAVQLGFKVTQMSIMEIRVKGAFVFSVLFFY